MDKPKRLNALLKDKTSSSHDVHIVKLLSHIDTIMAQTNQVHHTFLRAQSQTLDLYAMENSPLQGKEQIIPVRRLVFTKEQLHEFGTGTIAKCFGPEYDLLDQRDSPRIPNGDLLMIDQITAISGEPRKISPPASISSEFTVRQESWFLDENNYPGVPLSILMEIALQPCGILSAYLGTSLMLPVENNRFRNLDGIINFICSPDLIGKTICNHAVLKDAFTSGGMHIQKYSFELSLDGSIFMKGDSTFGYFTKMAMEQQTGLGPLQPQIDTSIEANAVPIQLENKHKKHLDLLNKVSFVSNSENGGNTIIFGEKNLSKDEWFYTNHFYQDPVMPGSLGVEAIMQGLWAYIKEIRYIEKFRNPVFSFLNKTPLTWKYRGQVTPSNQNIRFQVRLQNIHISTSEITITANADFWVDTLRIYSINNLALSIREG
jgi:3-hydroxymyristoyl/3-hydroxydecanoyl-(acyl carrier protein) dehydratase